MTDTDIASSDYSLKKKVSLDVERLISSPLYAETKSYIREIDSIPKVSLVQLKNWINQNRDIENCLLDDDFLYRFLRVRKYSIPMARQTLLKYLNFRDKFCHILCNLDYTVGKTDELITDGHIFASPFRDCNGRRVILYNFKNMDLSRITSLDIQRAGIITFETLIDAEETQIMGVTHVLCTEGVGPSYVPLFLTNDFGYLLKWGEQSFPMRHAEFSIMNTSRSVKYIYEMSKLLLSPKLSERLVLYDSFEDIKKKLGTKCLPLEMGGEVPQEEMIALFKEELAEKRDRLLSFDKMKLLNDKGIITRKNKVDFSENGSLDGSFRKLDID
ncbi:retinaldehyde-binding protein 1-like [Diorhabda carinulata]|uniref:retinaldehyde-binding protein 1-like n=1 Tax=Diorhabda carinulata TaxID=1163345 RepID=UPI0025A22AF8|nr:retinaldehyde-binding protein 1-like [Diorhabda carinulata]